MSRQRLRQPPKQRLVFNTTAKGLNEEQADPLSACAACLWKCWRETFQIRISCFCRQQIAGVPTYCGTFALIPPIEQSFVADKLRM